MRLRVIPIVAVIGAGAAVAWHNLPGVPAPGGGAGGGSFVPTIAMAPMSLGNRAPAAA